MNPSTHLSKPNKSDDVPLFLRKCYHMIETCDEKICCWSEDGLSFIVKDPNTFEKEIIPQFFKHSKMASFVRQLNFYGFKKVKFNDTLRIDEKLEAETANYCGFKHDKFQRDRQDLLVEIKRTQSKESSGGGSSTTRTSGGKGAVVNKASSNSVNPVFNSLEKDDVTDLRNELQTLKDRIAIMNSNIDELTTMVQNVNLHQSQGTENPLDNHLLCSVDPVQVGTKRKKSRYESYHDMDIDMEVLSSSCSDSYNILAISGDLEHELSFLHDLNVGRTSPFGGFATESDTCENLDSYPSDASFVDALFGSFSSEISEPEPLSITDLSPTSAVATPEKVPENEVTSSGPDQNLLCKLSDALSSLSKDAQEALMNRLINSINKVHNEAAAKSSEKKPMPERKESTKRVDDDTSLPVAAATLSALITQCSAAMKDRSLMKQKSLPVIPMHA